MSSEAHPILRLARLANPFDGKTYKARLMSSENHVHTVATVIGMLVHRMTRHEEQTPPTNPSCQMDFVPLQPPKLRIVRVILAESPAEHISR